MVKPQEPVHALIVEDEPDILELYALSLARLGVQTEAVTTLQEALGVLASGRRFQFCITDLRLPDGSGLELVKHIQQRVKDLPVAVVTAYGDVASAVEALKAGAFDFVTKPLSPARLREIVAHALRLSQSSTAAATEATQDEGDLIGQSPAMQALRALIAKVARTQAPVVIHGESGTGKELIARLIHRLGPRANGPFIPVNCGAIPAELIESELFGHRKGSFTGATADKPGLFRAAHGGTLFLDEVADLPLSAQVRLLRVLQERAVRPVGAVQEEPVDVRILSASHKTLAHLVETGKFRHDLYYRLNVIPMDVPPLRERRGDIPALAQHILNRLAVRDGTPVATLAPQALGVLCTHDYRGNVRELENLLERALALSDGDVLGAEDVTLAEAVATPVAEPMQTYDESPIVVTDRAVAADPEMQAILQALEAHRWNRTRAAEALGMTLRQLRYRLAKLEKPAV